MGAKSGIIYLINIQDNYKITELNAHINVVKDVKFAIKNNRFDYRNILISCSKDSSILLWNIKIKKLYAVFKPDSHPERIYF